MAFGNSLTTIRNVSVATAAVILLISIQMYSSSGYNLYLETYRWWFGLKPNSSVESRWH
jgi:hypothetical protein